jgi:uncharacterized protein YjeT (DUF2065 family)
VVELRDLATGVGLALAFEGAVWGAAPGAMRRAMRQLESSSDGALRAGALVALGIGVAIVWAARSALQGG